MAQGVLTWYQLLHLHKFVQYIDKISDTFGSAHAYSVYIVYNAHSVKTAYSIYSAYYSISNQFV